MIRLLGKYSRWKDPFNYKEFEVQFAGIISIVFLIILWKIEFYVEFSIYKNFIQNMLINIVVIMLGFAGVALSGVAIITGLFSQKQIQLIERHNGKDSFERIMSSFALMAFSSGIYAVFLMGLLIVLNSHIEKAQATLFWFVVVITVYFCLFNIFYTLALVANCIEIFQIRNIYDEIREKEKSF